MLSADDLRVFLEVARRGRLTEAAKYLKVSHTTVGRHVNQLERATGSRLFDRTIDGWTPTEAGYRLMEHAESVESALLAAQNDVFCEGAAMAGSVRILAPDGFGVFFLLPGLSRLRRSHPDLTIEVVTTNRHSSLAPREFDLAITIERPDARAVTVSKLTDFTLQLYASREYLVRSPALERVSDLAGHPVIWYVEDALEATTFNLLYELYPAARAVIQTNNIAGQVQAAEAGLGVAFLPTFIADRNPRLQRVEGVESDVHSSYWLSTPKDLRRLSRVRVVATFVEQLIIDDPRGFDRRSQD